MQKLLNETEVADLLGLSKRTLQKWRLEGGGPKYHKIGRLVRYDPADVEAWRQGRRVSSTSEELKVG